MAPVAYTDFIRIGRRARGHWRPARVRVSANVERGGLFALNEIVHEDGHAVHMMAVRARPADFDLGDDLFVEAFADVTSWSVAEAAWQRRYLGRSLDPQISLRALYANVVMDVAWGLFELRLLRDPEADPNRVWTEITSRYLNISPHRGIAWWAMRVQLVDTPGYMINYGLGAILTADLRQRFREQVGDFSAGNQAWYPYASAHLLRFGATVPTQALLQRFLGRPVAIEPLLTQIEQISTPNKDAVSAPGP
jgi:oligoendopeptidase F